MNDPFSPRARRKQVTTPSHILFAEPVDSFGQGRSLTFSSYGTHVRFSTVIVKLPRNYFLLLSA